MYWATFTFALAIGVAAGWLWANMRYRRAIRESWGLLKANEKCYVAALNSSEERAGELLLRAESAEELAAKLLDGGMFEYLDALREGGAVNMYFAAPYIEHAYPGLDKDQAKKVLQLWMWTYEKRHPEEGGWR